jgi:uncharacterized protein (DUF2236 family)
MSSDLHPSIARKINRERVVVLGWGRAILLQIAHPLIAAAVSDHSPFGADLRGYVQRARRTIGAMLRLTFGSDDEARRVVAGITAIHGQVHGTLREAAGVFTPDTVYSARDPHLLRWVYATLLDSLPLAYELFVGPLGPEEKDRYCIEAVPAGAQFGIDADLLPTRFTDLQCYMQQMLTSGEICVTDRARSLAQALLAPPLGPATTPLFLPARLTTVGLLPDSIRDGYGFQWDARHDRLFRTTATIVRRARPFVPPLIREWPAARRVA